jgi:FliG C-terminal domain
MSSLQRYNKPGGFIQLVSLIETFGPQKREKFLEMIEAESSTWAKALRDKMLSLERVFSWPDQVIIEVVKQLPLKNMAYMLMGLTAEQKSKVMPFFSNLEQRKIQDVVGGATPKPEEIQANVTKLVELARKMIQDKQLYPERFDEGLIVPEGFEEHLKNSGKDNPGKESHAKESHAKGDEEDAPALRFHLPESPSPASADVIQLQKALHSALKENKSLKDELRVAKEKLEQIRRIA